MEKDKKINIIIFCLAAIFIIVIGLAGYKVKQNHNDKLYLVVHKKIKEQAKECFVKKECEGRITLLDLYEKSYLDTVINPVTKENMDENICLEYIDEEVFFCDN